MTVIVDVPPPSGWVCPRCGRGCAPSVAFCPCINQGTGPSGGLRLTQPETIKFPPQRTFTVTCNATAVPEETL